MPSVTKMKQIKRSHDRVPRLRALDRVRSRHPNFVVAETTREVPLKRVMTAEQAKFVYFVAKLNMPHAAAVEHAGFKTANPGIVAARLLKTPHIREAIAIEKEKFAKDNAMSKKRVLDGLLEAVELAKTVADPHALTGAWREIGKMCGYYEPTRHKIDVTVNGNVTLEKLKGLTDAELLELAEANVIEGEATEVSALPNPNG